MSSAPFCNIPFAYRRYLQPTKKTQRDRGRVNTYQVVQNLKCIKIKCEVTGRYGTGSLKTHISPLNNKDDPCRGANTVIVKPGGYLQCSSSSPGTPPWWPGWTAPPWSTRSSPRGTGSTFCPPKRQDYFGFEQQDSDPDLVLFRYTYGIEPWVRSRSYLVQDLTSKKNKKEKNLTNLPVLYRYMVGR